MIKILFMGVDVMIKLDITMETDHPVLVFLALFSFILALLFFFVAFKLKTRPKSIFLCAFLLLSASVLLSLGILFRSDKLAMAGIELPCSLIFFFFSLSTLISYHKCRESVRAKLTDCRVSSSRSGWERCTPCFTYEYEGEPYESCSFLSYSKGTFQKLFETGGEYTIYIDPHTPNICADKRRFPLSSVVFAILFLAMFVFGVVVVVRG